MLVVSDDSESFDLSAPMLLQDANVLLLKDVITKRADERVQSIQKEADERVRRAEVRADEWVREIESHANERVEMIQRRSDEEIRRHRARCIAEFGCQSKDTYQPEYLEERILQAVQQAETRLRIRLEADAEARLELARSQTNAKIKKVRKNMKSQIDKLTERLDRAEARADESVSKEDAEARLELAQSQANAKLQKVRKNLRSQIDKLGERLDRAEARADDMVEAEPFRLLQKAQMETEEKVRNAQEDAKDEIRRFQVNYERQAEEADTRIKQIEARVGERIQQVEVAFQTKTEGMIEENAKERIANRVDQDREKPTIRISAAHDDAGVEAEPLFGKLDHEEEEEYDAEAQIDRFKSGINKSPQLEAAIYFQLDQLDAYNRARKAEEEACYATPPDGGFEGYEYSLLENAGDYIWSDQMEAESSYHLSTHMPSFIPEVVYLPPPTPFNDIYATSDHAPTVSMYSNFLACSMASGSFQVV